MTTLKADLPELQPFVESLARAAQKCRGAKLVLLMDEQDNHVYIAVQVPSYLSFMKIGMAMGTEARNDPALAALKPIAGRAMEVIHSGKQYGYWTNLTGMEVDDGDRC